MAESNNSDHKSDNSDGQEDARAFADRLRARAAELHISRSNLIAWTGIKKQTFAGYWNGERLPSAHALLQLSEELDCDPNWLLTGKGEGPKSGTLMDRRPGYRALPVQASDVVLVAEIDPRFGLGGVFMDEPPEPEMRSFSRAWLRQITASPPDQLYWVRGRGDSMEPAISDGDVCLIDRTETSPERFGDTYWAIAYGQTGMIKRLRPMPDGSVKILSNNPHVPPETAYEGELHVFGRVVAVVKMI